MNDDAQDPLAAAVLVLQDPVPIAPGLFQRAVARRRRRRVVRGTGAAVLVLGAIALIALRRSPGAQRITFAIDAPSVHSVALVGDFTDWRTDRVQLRERPSGVWEATVKLPPGRYRFAYLVDHAEWRADTHAVSAPDDFGRPTSVLTVREN